MRSTNEQGSVSKIRSGWDTTNQNYIDVQLANGTPGSFNVTCQGFGVSGIAWAVDINTTAFTPTSSHEFDPRSVVSAIFAADGAQLWKQNANDTFTNTHLNIQGGHGIWILDAANTDYAKFFHDGTNFNTTFLNTTAWNIAANVQIISGGALSILDAANTDALAMSHNGTDFAFSFSNTGNANWTGANLNMLDNGITRPLIKDYAISKYTPSSSGGVLTIDLNIANVAEYSFTENISTVTVNNPPASGKYGELTIKFNQHASVAKTITWASKYQFPEGDNHVMSTATSSIDFVHMFTINGGTTWYCTFVQNFS